MKVKITATMTAEEKDKLLSYYPEDFTIENVVFEMVAPNDDYQDIEVIITE